MSDDSQRPIIIKRIKKGGQAAHGGAWKIAYADFVTAMMAFFLLMWLLSSASKATLQGISEYFKSPLKVAMQGGEGSGTSSSVIKGGGPMLNKTIGELRRSTAPVEKKSFKIPPIKPAEGRGDRARETAKLKVLKAHLEEMIAQNPLLKKFNRQILLSITPEGLRIQIVDAKNRPMFSLGSTVLKPYMKEILHEIGKVLNEVPNRLSISGHTDATHYSGGESGYSNWELSTDRANASRRELIRGGMAKSKVLRVVGLASAVPFDPTNPLNPVNRRITLIVLNKQTEERIMRESAQSGVTNVPSLAKQRSLPSTKNAASPAPVATH